MSRQSSSEAQQDDGDAAESRDVRDLPRIARFITWPLVAVVLIHTLIIGLWVAPSTPLRDWAGQDRVREYVQPWFTQNWSIFAPTPRRAAVTFEVRSRIEGGGNSELEVTEWVDLIDNEDAIVAGNLFPARTAKITRRVTDRIHNAYSSMNTEQREWLQANYTDDIPVERLRERLTSVDGGANRRIVDNYMDADDAATRIASGFAEVEWGELGDVVDIQYRTSTRPAPAWDDEEQTIDDTTRSERDYGWRTAAEVDESELAYLEKYFTQGGL